MRIPSPDEPLTEAELDRLQHCLENFTHLAEDLSAFIECSDSYDPRNWAFENISNTVSIAKLNDLLKTAAEKDGRLWTRDISLVHWWVSPAHLDEIPDDLRAAYAALKKEHALSFTSVDMD